MAKLMKVQARKLPAATLVEVTTAMVIISIVFGLSVMIYLNLGASSGISERRVKAKMVLEGIATETKKDKVFVSESFSYEHFDVEKQILPYQNSTKVILLQLEAISKSGKVVAKHREIVYQPTYD